MDPISFSRYQRLVPQSCLLEVPLTQDLIAAFVAPTNNTPRSFQQCGEGAEGKPIDSKFIFSKFLEGAKFGSLVPVRAAPQDLFE